MGDAARYVVINKAYEVLSSQRRDYDEYLRIRGSMDSPVESPFVVLGLLYLLIAYVVLHYQRQQQKQCKEAILSHANVIRYYWESKNIDLTGKKKPSKKGREMRSVAEIKEDISRDEMNEVIHRLNLLIPEWKETEPTYQQALLDVLSSVLWLFQETIFRVRWFVSYSVLRMAHSDDDREVLCRRHNKLDEAHWMTMPDAEREKLMNKPGPWKAKKQKAQ